MLRGHGVIYLYICAVLSREEKNTKAIEGQIQWTRTIDSSSVDSVCVTLPKPGYWYCVRASSGGVHMYPKQLWLKETWQKVWLALRSMSHTLNESCTRLEIHLIYPPNEEPKATLQPKPVAHFQNGVNISNNTFSNTVPRMVRG